MLDRGYFEDLLGQLEPIALDMDRTGDGSNVHLLFRLVHNLKSSVAQEGLVALATEVHHLEDLLDRIRRGKSAWNTGACDLVMQVIDQVRRAVEGPETVEEREAAALQAGAPPAEPAPAPAEASQPLLHGLPLNPLEAQGADLALTLGQGLYRIEKLFKRGLARDVFKHLPVLEDIQELGTLIAQHPSWEAYDAGPEEQVVKFLFASSRTEEELSAIIFDPLIVLQEPRARVPAKVRDRLRLLVVEDNAVVAGLLYYILRDHGDCTVCESGTEALAVFHAAWALNEPLDLVVLDLILPDMHGDQVLKEIRTFEARRGLRPPNHQCLVLMNTATLDVDQMKASLVMEPDGYLLKPMNVEVVIELIETLKATRLEPRH